MRKHLFVTLLLTCGLPFSGQMFAVANPMPQSQSQAAVTITGTVLDENDEPVIGASVTPKGSTKGVSTDVFGHFTMKVAPGTPLTVSFVGYKNENVKAAADMTVYLQPTTEVLDQLVVVGYGTQKKANLTGAVATVDVARVMDSRPATDVAKALQGAVPGLTITSASGDIAGNPTINIRGVGTLSNGHTSNPLIVVDGVPVDDMSFLNPEDIEDISVLKDAASSAVYGTRAAFGVILITTKTPNKKDRVSVKYNNNFSWGHATVLPDPNTTVNQLKVAMDDTNLGGDKEIFSMYYDDLLPFAEAWAAQHGGKKYTSYVELHPFQNAQNVGDYYVFDFKTNNISPLTGLPMRTNRFMSYADWDVAKTYFRTAPGQKHNVSLEGSSGKTSYRLSFGYDSREGLNKFSPDKMARYMANASIDTEIFSFLKAGARFSFSDKEYTSPQLNRNSYQYLWRFPSFFEMPGYVYNENGEAQSFRNDVTVRMQGHRDKTVTTQTRMQAWMRATVAKGLTIQADFTYDLRNQNSDAATVPYSAWNNWTPGNNTLGSWVPYTQATSLAAQSNYRDDMWTANVFGTYEKTFAEKNHLKVMLGWTAEQEEYKYFYASRTGLVDYNLPNINLTNGTTYVVNGNNTHRATTGFFGRINYDYKGIYLFEANGRYDGSSKFPAADQWAFFPSFSAGYRFSEEKYFEPLTDWWSNGKLRASYGHIGNEAVGENRFLSTVGQVSAGSVYWIGSNGQKITEYSMPSLVSSSLTWERIVTTDIGIDLGFFKNALNVTFDWFNRDTKDMLGPGQELPQILGAGAPYQNNGELRTRGWELGLNWNQSFGDWDVYANFNIGDSRTKITKWNNATGLIYTYLPTENSYTPGQYFGDIWGFETDRYFTLDEFTYQPNADPEKPGRYVANPGTLDQSFLEDGSFHYGPGDIKFKDLNGDGVINEGNPNMIELNGKTYIPGQAGYEAALADKDSKVVPTRTLKNHGDLKVIGNALPRFEYSFRLGGAWKGFDLDIFFQGVGKRNMWATGSTIIPMCQSALGTFTNQLDNYNLVTFDALGKITDCVIDQNNEYPRMYSGSDGTGVVKSIGQGHYNFYPQSRYLMDLSYLRIKNLTFGYTLPVQITQKALIQKARLYFSADNLCFLHNGAGKYQLDPEQTSSSNGSTQGFNGGQATYGRTVPYQRVLSFGLQVTF
ncbi:MAG: TonB-dependent receptor [Bacteroidales bacterium]|nr:TonB-dependent receptor [Bacteroidales bacterium]